MRTLAAIVWLKATDTALALHTVTTRLAGVTHETPMYRRLDSAVARADSNPHLPQRFRDPRDVADTLRSI